MPGCEHFITRKNACYLRVRVGSGGEGERVRKTDKKHMQVQYLFAPMLISRGVSGRTRAARYTLLSIIRR